MPKENPVTVEAALRRARNRITYPCMFLFLGGTGLTFWAGFQMRLPAWGALFVFLPPLVIVFLYWNVQIPKWKVWAFTHVRNVQELEQEAIKHALIAPKGHFLNRMELWSVAHRKQWKALQGKFAIPDAAPVYAKDPTVPPETAIYESALKNYLEAASCLVMTGTGIALVFWTQNSTLPTLPFWVVAWCGVAGVAIALSGAWLGFKAMQRALNRKAIILLSNKGIQTSITGFQSWGQVQEAKVYWEFTGDSRDHYLKWTLPQGAEIIGLNTLNKKPKTIKHLLSVYQGRYHRRD